MATVDKTWVFLADAEGLADVGDSAISVVWDTGGNPGGSLEFLGAATGTTERARRAATGQTWETWGVPAGATVNSVQVISFDSRKWSNATTPTVKVRVVDSAAASVHTAGDLVSLSLGTGADAAWVANGAGTSRAVDAAKQASTTDVRLEVQLDLLAATTSLDVGLDNILLRITYTASGGAVVTFAATPAGAATVTADFVRQIALAALTAGQATIASDTVRARVFAALANGTATVIADQVAAQRVFQAVAAGQATVVASLDLPGGGTVTVVEDLNKVLLFFHTASH